MIKVKPAPEARRDFARWAVAQVPKIRTVSPVEFGVPDSLFTVVPEDLLYGALVDDQPYVPVMDTVPEGVPEGPEDDDQDPEGPEGGDQDPEDDDGQDDGPELLGVGTVDGGVQGPAFTPEDLGPLVPNELSTGTLLVGEAGPETAPAPDTATAGDRRCMDCPRSFKSDRALSMHRHHAHPDQE